MSETIFKSEIRNPSFSHTANEKEDLWLTLMYHLLLFNFNFIRDLTNRCILFSVIVTEYASFLNQARTLKTNVIGLISIFF